MTTFEFITKKNKLKNNIQLKELKNINNSIFLIMNWIIVLYYFILKVLIIISYFVL